MHYVYTSANFKEVSSISRQLRMKIKNDGYATCYDFYIVTGQLNEEVYMNANYKVRGWNTLLGFKIDKTSDGKWCLETPEVVEVIREINEYKKRRKNNENRNYE